MVGMPGDCCDAIVCRGPRDLGCDRVRLTEVGPGQVLVRTSMSGVSTGTDKWVVQGTFGAGRVRFPAVPGYQRVGVVERLGEDVEGIEVGQRVVTTSGVGFVDVRSTWGGHASRALSDAEDVYDADGIPDERAAFVVVAQVGYNAASRLLLGAGARVLVVGDGVIGSSAAYACRARGFDVLVAGRHRCRLDRLRAADFATVDTRASDPAQFVAAYGPVAVIDTVQNDAAFALYVPRLPWRTGQIVYSGHSPGGVTAWADMAVLQEREFTVHFVSGIARDRVEATLGLMRTGHMPSEHLLGTIARTAEDARALMRTVAEGRLEPTAAAIDWSWAE